MHKTYKDANKKKEHKKKEKERERERERERKEKFGVNILNTDQVVVNRKYYAMYELVS